MKNKHREPFCKIGSHMRLLAGLAMSYLFFFFIFNAAETGTFHLSYLAFPLLLTFVRFPLGYYLHTKMGCAL